MPPTGSGHRGHPPRIALAVLRALLPHAERDEVAADLTAEYRERAGTDGPAAARRWLRRQVLTSVPSLLRRGWWRGMTGFEPETSRMRPGGPMFESWIMDLRYACRRLRSRPTYAALAVFTLALGAGGTAAAFGVMRTLLLQPLPIAHEAQVGVFWFGGSWTESEFLHLRPRFVGFQRVAAHRPDNATLNVTGGPLRLVAGESVSSEFFEVLGVRAMLGRTFREGDDRVGAAPSSVLSYRLWQELGSDPALVGRTLEIGGVQRVVIGVMPRAFWFPSPITQAWHSTPLRPNDNSGRYTLVGRAAEGHAIERMEAPLGVITSALAERYRYTAQWDKTKAPAITSVREFLVGEARPSVTAAFAAMALILLMACANLAALMLGQVDAQSTDLAVRAALGADRRRLIQQLASESLLIGLLAGVSGAALAALGFSVLVRSLPLGDLAEGTQLDWVVFGASLWTALCGAVLVAVLPGIAVWRRHPQPALATKRAGGVGGRGGRMEGGLVVAQVALAVLLAAGAGLLVRSVVNLRAIDPGIDVDSVAVIDAVMPTDLSHGAAQRVIRDTVANLQALPGVRAAAASQKIPLRGSGYNWGLGIKGRTNIGGTTAFRTVSRDYFKALGMRVTRGRDFETGDRTGAERVVIINEAMAATYFPAEDPIGKTILTFGGSDPGERVVGVVENAAEAGLTDAPVPARYLLYDQLPAGVSPAVAFVLKADSGAQLPAVLETARAAIRRDGTQLAVQKSTTTREIFGLALGATGQVVILLTLLASCALVLGAVGVYGVISHHVTRRTRDYGICIALGETPRRVVLQIVRRGVALVAAGCVMGVGAALPLTKLLAALLYGVAPIDPVSLSITVVVLLTVGGLAAFVPARRASLTDPAVVLRQT